MVLGMAPSVPEEWELLIDAVNGLNSGDALTGLFALAFFVWYLGPALLPLLVGLAQRNPVAGVVTSILAALASILSLPVTFWLGGLVGETGSRYLALTPLVVAVVATMVMERILAPRRTRTRSSEPSDPADLETRDRIA
jgi:low temperature requirement protein LtrA